MKKRATEAPPRLAPPERRSRVLVVDDQAAMAETIAEGLTARVLATSTSTVRCAGLGAMAARPGKLADEQALSKAPAITATIIARNRRKPYVPQPIEPLLSILSPYMKTARHRRALSLLNCTRK